MTGRDIRRTRNALGIPGAALCGRTSLCRTKLSDIEHGYVVPSPQELEEIRRALAEFAREKIILIAAATKSADVDLQGE